MKPRSRSIASAARFATKTSASINDEPVMKTPNLWLVLMPAADLSFAGAGQAATAGAMTKAARGKAKAAGKGDRVASDTTKTSVEKTAAARKDATEDKREADYKVAIE